MKRIAQVLSVLALSIATSSVAHAGYYTSGSWSTSPDEGAYEAYGEAVDDWSGTANSSLSATISGTWDWLDYMVDAGHSYRYSTDSSAWSYDFEEGYNDSIYNDAADLSYVSTHGSSAAFYLNGSYGDDKVSSSDARWGNGDSEAIFIDACQVLDSNGRTAMGNALLNDGIHFVFGFQSNALDTTTTADLNGYYGYEGYSLVTSWISATMAGHSSSYTAAYVRFSNASCFTYNDTVYNRSCDPKSGSTWVYSSWAL